MKLWKQLAMSFFVALILPSIFLTVSSLPFFIQFRPRVYDWGDLYIQISMGVLMVLTSLDDFDSFIPMGVLFLFNWLIAIMVIFLFTYLRRKWKAKRVV